MPSYLIIDGENTGLFDYGRPADAAGQPRLASLAMIALNPDREIEHEYHALVRPDGWEMPPEASAINGLTTPMLIERGVPVRDVLEEFARHILTEGRVVVSHNAAHDLKQLRAELRRAGMDDLINQTRSICTMRGLISHVPRPDGRKKMPKLSEACAHFGYSPVEEHSALNDARGCLHLFNRMAELGILPEPALQLSKGRA